MATENSPRAPADGSGDSRRELERHALRNVRWLFEKLHYEDAFDQRKDRLILIGLVAVAFVLILGMTVHVIVAAPKPDATQVARCEQDFKVARIWELKRELARKHPHMGASDMEKQVELHWKDMKPVATIACKGGSKHGDG